MGSRSEVPLDQQIERLRNLRTNIADLGGRLAERELAGRLLRVTIETELRQQGSTKTDAEKGAKTDPRYLDHERGSIEITFNREITLAEAEARRFAIELQLAVLRREQGVTT